VAYHRPSSLAQALEIAAESEITPIAGGTDIFPAAKQGQPPRQLLDVTGIAELSTITRTDDGFRFGSAVSWSDVVKAELPPAFDTLKKAALEVGSIQIQNSGTVAGNICNASPAADGVPPLLALDATVEIGSHSRGTRHVPLSDFILGVRKTALNPDELVTAIRVPNPPKNSRSSFQKLGSRKYLVISIAMVSAIIAKNEEGRVSDARIAVGSCSAVALRLPELEAYCLGKRAEDIIVLPEHLTPLTPIDDIRGSAQYRNDAVAELCARAISPECRGISGSGRTTVRNTARVLGYARRQNRL